jgi:hypothetical protein
MKSLKKLPTPAQIDKVEADVGMVFTCHDTEGLERFKEQRKAEIAEKKFAQNTQKNTDTTK